MALPPVSTAVILAMLAIAVVCDVRSRTVPGLLTLGGIATGLLGSMFLHGSVLTSLLGAAAGFGAVVFFVWRGLLGEGDALLLAAVGAWSSWEFALTAVFWTSLVGAVMALAYLSIRRPHCGSGPREYPYVPAIAAGTLIAALIR